MVSPSERAWGTETVFFNKPGGLKSEDVFFDKKCNNINNKRNKHHLELVS